MQFKQLFDDDRAVSPVIGVILMVAITVILAAVIGTFVLGLGDQVQNTTPQAQFGFDTGGSEKCKLSGSTQVTVTHESGDSIDASDLSFADSTGASDDASNCGFSNTVSAGSSGVITTTSGETLRVIYDNPDNDKSATISSYEVP